jgi:hypothetical protein
MVTYEETYQSFIKYRAMLGLAPIAFEDWMHRREEPIKSPAQKTKEFLDSQVHAGAGAV